MTQRIFKFAIEIVDKQTLMLPAGARLLDVQMQVDQCCIWALCPQDAEYEPRNFAIYGTGRPIPDAAGEYVATFQMYGGALVYHVFDLTTAV